MSTKEEPKGGCFWGALGRRATWWRDFGPGLRRLGLGQPSTGGFLAGGPRLSGVSVTASIVGRGRIPAALTRSPWCRDGASARTCGRVAHGAPALSSPAPNGKKKQRRHVLEPAAAAPRAPRRGQGTRGCCYSPLFTGTAGAVKEKAAQLLLCRKP